MKTAVRLLLIPVLCTLVSTPASLAQGVRPAQPVLARLADLVWREGEARQLPAATAEAFGYGAKQLAYRVLVIKKNDEDRHEAMVVLLDDGTRAIHLARRLPTDLWLVRSTPTGEYARGFHRLVPRGAPVEMDAADGQQLVAREEAFWAGWMQQRDSLPVP